MSKLEPFLRQRMEANFKYNSFDELKISVATVNVKLVADAGIDFPKLIYSLPVIDADIMKECPGVRWPPGTITGAKHKDIRRGLPPNPHTKGFKNSTTIWIWLEGKEKEPVCAKISHNSIHITGCKTFDNAAETTRLIQQHLIALQKISKTTVYENHPYAIDFHVCMVNFNFTLGVAIDLIQLDLFIDEYCDMVYSPYNQNVHHTTMPVKCPDLSSSYTIHDNGQICMGARNINVGRAMIYASKSYVMLKTFLELYKNARFCSTNC